MMRRWTIRALVLLLALSVAGWVRYVPSSALNPLKPVPAHAQMVYQNSTPGWFLSFFPLFEKGGGNHSGLWNKNLQTLKEKPLVAATASLGGHDRRDTWVVVSAIGPQAVLFRWQMVFFPPENIQQLHSYGAWPVWQYTDPSFPAGMRVRFSIAEGLLICSVSDDSHDINYLLDTLDGRRPSAERKEER